MEAAVALDGRRPDRDSAAYKGERETWGDRQSVVDRVDTAMEPPPPAPLSSLALDARSGHATVRLHDWVQQSSATDLSGASRADQRLALFGFDDYEVVFTEARLGLTLKAETAPGLVPVTVVKSVVSSSHCASRVQEGDMLLSVNGGSVVSLELSDVLYVLKTAERPMHLRFRASGQAVAIARTRAQSGSLFEALAPSLFVHLREPHEDREDSDSQDAVFSESFGDANSSQTTENSSVVTDLADWDDRELRQPSRLSVFLRKPFRRADGLELGRPRGLRIGVVPPPPRVEMVLESPCKAAIRVRWRLHPKALACHLQFARDRAVRVWKSWTGRPRRTSESTLELVSLISGLDYSKTYVVRCRYVFDTTYAPADWSAPSLPMLTRQPPRQDANAHRS